MLFECPAYHRIRLKYETALFSKFGGVSRVARSMKFPGKVSAFMTQEPRRVAAFVKRDHCTALWAVQHPSMTPTGFVSVVC